MAVATTGSSHRWQNLTPCAPQERTAVCSTAPTWGRRRPIRTVHTTARGIGITASAAGSTSIGTTITVAWRCGLSKISILAASLSPPLLVGRRYYSNKHELYKYELTKERENQRNNKLIRLISATATDTTAQGPRESCGSTRHRTHNVTHKRGGTQSILSVSALFL